MVGQSWKHPVDWYNTNVISGIKLIEGIKKHDWLRRRAGILESVTSEYYSPIIKNFFKILIAKEKFFKTSKKTDKKNPSNKEESPE